MIRRLIAIAGVLILSAALPAQGAWQLSKEGGGIRVFTRTVEGSAMKEFRAVMLVDGNVDMAVALITDHTRFCEWFDRCGEARLIQTVAGGSVNYIVSKQPAVVSDRDLYVRSILRRDPASGAATIQLEGLPQFAPAKPGLARIPTLRGFWRFAPASDGKIEVVYQVHADPGGGIPAFIANMNVTDSPFNTLANFRRLLPQYAAR